MKFSMPVALLVGALFFGASFAQAESMSCMVGVYTANDMLDTSGDATKNTIVATLPLVAGQAAGVADVAPGAHRWGSARGEARDRVGG